MMENEKSKLCSPRKGGKALKEGGPIPRKRTWRNDKRTLTSSHFARRRGKRGIPEPERVSVKPELEG